jgi:acyl-CoA hydrolase
MNMAAAPGHPDLREFIRAGDTVMWGQAHAQPLSLIEALVHQRHSIGRTRLLLGIGYGLESVLRPEHADAFDFLSYCAAGSNRGLARSGVLDLLPLHYSEMANRFRDGSIRIDVLMLQVPPPDEAGRYSLGMAREYLIPALARARTVLAEVDPAIPWTHGEPYLRESDFQLLIAARARQAPPVPLVPGPIEQAIGRHVADMVPDGATVQTGIGSLPDAVLAALKDHRNLGIHSGSLGDGVALLSQAGVITNSRKSLDPGVTVGGMLMGGERLRQHAHRNPAVELRGTEYTHDLSVLARQDRFTAINSAVEVDLTGQVNSEVAGGNYVGAVGGSLDFVRGAVRSKGGTPIIALPSMAGERSRIVSALAGPVTIPRSDACVIVTEHGVADLRGLSLSQRVARMIAIADPRHQEDLRRAVRDGSHGPLAARSIQH